MGAIGPWQIAIILVLALLLFGGGGRISSIMGDFAKGIRSFRKGLQEENKDAADAPKSLEGEAPIIDADAAREKDDAKTS